MCPSVTYPYFRSVCCAVVNCICLYHEPSVARNCSALHCTALHPFRILCTFSWHLDYSPFRTCYFILSTRSGLLKSRISNPLFRISCRIIYCGALIFVFVFPPSCTHPHSIFNWRSHGEITVDSESAMSPLAPLYESFRPASVFSLFVGCFDAPAFTVSTCDVHVLISN